MALVQLCAALGAGAANTLVTVYIQLVQWSLSDSACIQGVCIVVATIPAYALTWMELSNQFVGLQLCTFAYIIGC